MNQENLLFEKVEYTPENVKKLVDLAVRVEREACIKVCQSLVVYGPVAEAQQRYNQAYWHCVDAIRAREKQ